jgi:hypothetical protein
MAGSIQKIGQTGHPESRFVLVCTAYLEREWVQASCMAGTLPAADYFAPTQ